ncbi:MAG: AbrB/MazE/SpoVT family DNA-binding domain-containing protein [Methanosarcinaceae archaeon]|nr:AbrB/MazE/SpoVT family DNA-binding domain-containing protein [Methanosarcinaceae archaeon]
MSLRKVSMMSPNKAIVLIPAYLRDKFNLGKGSVVDVTDDGKHIIITPQGSE